MTIKGMIGTKTRKYVVTFRPKGTKSLFINSSFDTKAKAENRVNQILKKKRDKRVMLNPRVSKNPFFKR